MPVIAETYDGTLSDINGRHVTEAHALEALDRASSGAVAEGSVGVARG
jgi:D-aminopeptidase